MATNSRSGLTQEEREGFLRDHGFERVRSGKGSHEMWEHPELKLLARSHSITSPPNLLANTAQNPWECTLCANPAINTWRSMSKHIKWCHDTVQQMKAGSEHAKSRCELARQFRKAAKDMKEWKRGVILHLKTGLPASDIPKAPLHPHDFLVLKAKKNQLSSVPA